MGAPFRWDISLAPFCTPRQLTMVQLLCSSSPIVLEPTNPAELEYSLPSRPTCQIDSLIQADGTYPMIQSPLNLDSLHCTVVPYRPIGHYRVLGHLGRLQDPEIQLKAN